MRGIIFVMLFGGLLSYSWANQPEKSAQQQTPQNLRKWALQFALKSNFTLGSFQGSLFSGRFYFSPRHAIQLGLSGNLDTKNSTREVLRDDSTYTPEEGSVKNISTGVVIQYLWISHPVQRLRSILGLGPSVNYKLDGREFTVYSIYNNYSYKNRVQLIIETTITGLIGFEWALKENIWLTVFYRNQLGYRWVTVMVEVERWSNGQQEFYSKDTNKERGVVFRNNGVFLGLTIQL